MTNGTSLSRRDDPGRRRRAGGRRGCAAGGRCRRRPVRVHGRLVGARRRRRRDRYVRRRHPRRGPRGLRRGGRRSCSARSVARSGPIRAPRSAPSRRSSRCAAGSGLYANLRPVTVQPTLAASSPLRPELLDGVDMVIVRELTGGIYFGDRTEASAEPRRPRRPSTLSPTPSTRSRGSFVSRSSSPGRRRGSVTSVDKANVLATSRLWRRVADEVAVDYPDVRLDAPARRFVRDAAHPPAGRLRRDRHREPVRRHPVGRGVGPRREPRPVAVRVARGASDRARPVRPLRADPRLRPGHRRSRHREPDRHDPLGGDAAADVARTAGCRGRDRGRGRRARLPTAGGPATWPIPADPADGLVVVGTTGFTTAVLEALEAGAGVAA